MAWLVLVLSGLLETVWAAALHEATVRPRAAPMVAFAIAAPLSLIGLGFALRVLPLGTSYAVWVGIGALGTVAYGIAVAGDSTSPARLACVLLIIAGVAGLKLVE